MTTIMATSAGIAAAKATSRIALRNGPASILRADAIFALGAAMFAVRESQARPKSEAPMTNPTPAANTHAAAPVVRIPDERLARIFRDEETRRAIEARLNGEAHIQAMRDRLNGKTRHRVIPDLTWGDDPLELWHDIRSAPLSHAVVAVVTVILWTTLLVLPLVLL
jgi:hypothetical protein